MYKSIQLFHIIIITLPLYVYYIHSLILVIQGKYQHVQNITKNIIFYIYVHITILYKLHKNNAIQLKFRLKMNILVNFVFLGKFEICNQIPGKLKTIKSQYFVSDLYTLSFHLFIGYTDYSRMALSNRIVIQQLLFSFHLFNCSKFNTPKLKVLQHTIWL